MIGSPQDTAFLVIGLGVVAILLCGWLVYMAARNKLPAHPWPQPPAPGQLFVFRDDRRRYGVMKVLLVRDGLVHPRMYSNRWPAPPNVIAGGSRSADAKRRPN